MMSIRVAGLLLLLFVYAVVLLVQMEMMGIVDNDHATTFFPGAPARVKATSRATAKRRTKIADRLTARAQSKHSAHRKNNAQMNHHHHHLTSQTNPDQIQLYATLATSIADKWNLTTPNAVELLLQQFYKVNDYDSKRDFIHFHHLYKSGGTSISNLMLKAMKDILPGSYESGDFNHEEALEDIK